MAIGFMVAVPSAMAGDRLSAFLGFLIVSGALGFVAALTLVLRLSVRVSAIGESIEDVSHFLDHSNLATTTVYLRRLEGQEDKSWPKVAAAIGV